MLLLVDMRFPVQRGRGRNLRGGHGPSGSKAQDRAINSIQLFLHPVQQIKRNRHRKSVFAGCLQPYFQRKHLLSFGVGQVSVRFL